ncbi:MAG: histidinol-phosphate transaminase [Tatlockia sp.]|nr:histidinol-phosphate transaminase [Tatlockia sp.]
MSVLNLIRKDLITIKNYTPKGDELDCRLHANELPWAALSMDNLPLNHYPELKEQKKLETQVAEHYQLKSEQILLTRGSDDAIDFLMRLFLTAREDSFMQCPPTFPMYEFYARLQQVETINCHLNAEEGFSFSAENLMACWQPNCKLIMLCNPNNPTATLIDLATIAKLCQRFRDEAIVVVDEAYFEFTQMTSASTLLSSFDNLIILRTLSKAYGLAGLRLGAIIAQPQLIEAMRKLIPPYTLPSPVIHLAQRALADKDWFNQKIQLILAERELLSANFKRSPWIKTVYPSKANFILVASFYAQILAKWFSEHSIAVRYFDTGSMQSMLRITVGNPDQNQRMLAALASFKP